ncbi:gasdermin-D [Nannospalax galili]|uniref:Gasdermin D n=1 Tax=Nannospalax galili TaxID=1026970 RepID=A0A8C6QR75_NANGA|nr:gasdermin-D [Nannospalax galili]
MPSTFELVVRSVLQELDQRGDLTPVDSLQKSTSFRPYYLLSRKHPSSWFWKPRYTCVNLSIKDILEPDAPEPEPECGGPFRIDDAVDGKAQGSVKLEAPGQGKISGGAVVSGSSSVSIIMHTLCVAPNTWETMHRERRLRQPEHKILQQLRSHRNDVFVVTEVLQTQEKVQVTQTRKKGASGQFALLGAMCLQGEGEGHLSKKKMVTIPAGSILAFRVSQLLIGSNWDILLVPDEKKRTFEQPPKGHRNAGDQQQHTKLRFIHEHLRFLSDGTPGEGVVSEDFQGLGVEVEAGSSELKHLEMELKQQLLVNIGRILQDLPSLEALEASLEQGLCNGGQVQPLDGPAGNILQCLVLPSGELVPQLAAPVFYLLGALTVLNETQYQLLAKMLETGVLSEQLELVENLLEQSTPWQEQSSVTLPPRFLGGSWDEDAPAWVLLEECGLELQMDAPQVHWKPNAQGPVCALYASLALLSRLSQEPC